MEIKITRVSDLRRRKKDIKSVFDADIRAYSHKRRNAKRLHDLSSDQQQEINKLVAMIDEICIVEIVENGCVCPVTLPCAKGLIDRFVLYNAKERDTDYGELMVWVRNFGNIFEPWLRIWFECKPGSYW